MYRRSLKTHKTFSSRTEKAVVIGGETDYCAERYAYKREINGITPLPYFKRFIPLVNCNNVTSTMYAPVCGRVFFSTSAGNLYGWNTVTKGAPITMGILTAEILPHIHYCVEETDNIYVAIAGNKISRIFPNSRIKMLTMGQYLKDTAIHCGRIFGIDSTNAYMLRWSGYAYDDWVQGVDGAGYVVLDSALGVLLNLFVFGDKIIVVREYGITVLTTLGDSRHSRIDICDRFSLPRVYPDSSAICGGQLWIYTRDGMYAFDGSSVTKKPFDEIMRDYYIDRPTVIEDTYIYYTATKDGVNYLFVYDTRTGACSPYAKTCFCPFFIEDEPYCFNGTYVQSLLYSLDDPERKWVSKPFTFPHGKPRTLKSLRLNCSGHITVEVDCDGRKLYLYAPGEYVYAESGQSFTFKVTGNGSVTGLTAEWEVRG